MYTFVPNKSFGNLFDISPKIFAFLETFNSVFSYIEVWFNDQKSKPLETEDKLSVTLVINLSQNMKMVRYSVQPRDRIFVTCNICKIY